jgi:ankyrin repeat protein
LESLRRRTAVPTSEVSTVKRLKKNDLNTELLEVLDGRTALHWAVYLNNLALVKMLLEYAAIDGAETLKKVMTGKDDTKDCPCISAICINNLECIMVSVF